MQKRKISIQIQDKDLANKFRVDYKYNSDVISETWEPEISIPDLSGCLSLLTQPYGKKKLKLVWGEIQRLLKDDALAQATIVAVQGKYGWDDYHLVHHFDEAEPLDTLSEHANTEDW